LTLWLGLVRDTLRGGSDSFVAVAPVWEIVRWSRYDCVGGAIASPGSTNYFGSADSALIAADFTREQARDFTVRKEILRESETASDSQLAAKEVAFIRKLNANDPATGYNRWPRYTCQCAGTRSWFRLAESRGKSAAWCRGRPQHGRSR